jgi:hypothetical protein
MVGHGGSNAGSQRNGNGSSKPPLITAKENAGMLADSSSITLDEAIQMHLVDCDQCRKVAAIARPIALGEKSGHCDTYWALQLLRAESEGKANNIVAYTEYGDEAPKGGDLE